MLEILNTAPTHIKEHIIQEKFKKNEMILVQGDVNEYLYFIQSGIVEITTISKQGLDLSITTFTTGESIGVLEIFNPEIHTQNAIVIEDCSILKLHKKYVLRWMKEDFNFTLYVIKLLEECFYDTSIFARNLLSLKIEERIIVSLDKHSNNNTLYSLTKNKLATETGTKTRSLNRVLKDLINSGLLEYKNKRFKILDKKLLSKKAKDIL
jgi:CRP-like cAMP-binding protein